MRFSRVSSVLSSVFPPALSCSLTSEHKQEAPRRADTSLQLSHAGSQSPNGSARSKRAVTQDLFVLVCHSTMTLSGNRLCSLQLVYSVGDII